MLPLLLFWFLFKWPILPAIWPGSPKTSKQHLTILRQDVLQAGCPSYCRSVKALTCLFSQNSDTASNVKKLRKLCAFTFISITNIFSSRSYYCFDTQWWKGL